MSQWWVLSLVLASAVAGAETVYKTVNEQGVTTFSDTPPAGENQVEVLEFDVPPPQDPEAYKERLASMRETTDRMAEDRRAREKHRAELRAEERKNREPQYVYQQPYPYYYGSGYRRIVRPPWRPKPELPIYRPPIRPDLINIDAPNSQLMRPLVSQGLGSNQQLMRPLVSSFR